MISGNRATRTRAGLTWPSSLGAGSPARAPGSLLSRFLTVTRSSRRPHSAGGYGDDSVTGRGLNCATQALGVRTDSGISVIPGEKVTR